MPVQLFTRHLAVRGVCVASALSKLPSVQATEGKLTLWTSVPQTAQIDRHVAVPGRNAIGLSCAVGLSNGLLLRNISYSAYVAVKTNANSKASTVTKDSTPAVDPEEVCQVFDETEKLIGQMKALEAEALARKDNLRLVNMGKNSDGLHSFRLMSGRALAEEMKRQHAEKKAEKVKEKEFRVKSNITDHDLDIKLRQVKETIGRGDHVKFVIKAHKQAADGQSGDRAIAQLMKKVTSKVQDLAQIKQGIRNPSETQLILKPINTNSMKEDA